MNQQKHVNRIAANPLKVFPLCGTVKQSLERMFHVLEILAYAGIIVWLTIAVLATTAFFSRRGKK